MLHRIRRALIARSVADMQRYLLLLLLLNDCDRQHRMSSADLADMLLLLRLLQSCSAAPDELS
jgi:hypothetical protein